MNLIYKNKTQQYKYKQEDKIMKTPKCSTRKILKKISLSILAIIISTGMFAQKSLNTFDLKQYASDLFQTTAEIITEMNKVKEKRAFYEEEIRMEEWMINLEQWAEKTDSFGNSGNKENKIGEVILEERFELENWMMDLKEWKCPEKEIFTEEEMDLEQWMYNLKCFMD